MYHNYYIPLNKTSLLLFGLPPKSSKSQLQPHPQLVVVQVTVKPAHENTIDELVVFYLNQCEITKAIEMIIEAHISTSELARRSVKEIEVEGEEYVLCGTSKPWLFGQSLCIKAGNTVMQKAEDKWVFTVQCRRRGAVAPRDSSK